MNYEDEDQVPLTPAERLLANAYRGSNNNVEWSSDIPDWVQREIGRRNEQLARPESESVFARLQTRQVEDVAGNPVTQLSYWRKDQQTKFPDKAYNLYYNQQFDALGVSDPYSSTVRFFTGQVNAERVAQDAETPLFSRRSRDQVFSDFVRRPSMMFREPDAGFAAPHFKMNRNELSAEVFVNLQGSYQLPKSREVFNKKGEIFEKRMFAQDSMAAVEFVRGSTGNRTLTPFKSLVVDPGNLFGKTALPFGQDRLFSEKAKDHRREFREKNAIGRSPTQVGSLDQPAFRYAGSPTKSGTRAAHMWVDDYGFFSEGGAFTLHNDLQVMSPSQFRIQGSAGMSAKDLEAQGFVVGAVYGQQKPEWEMEGGLHYAGDRAELGGYHVGNNEHAYVGGLTRMEGGDWVATMVGVNPFHNAENKPSAFMKDQMQPVTENHVLMQMGKKILGKFPASIQPMPLKDERLPSMALRIFMAHEQGAKGVYGDLMGLAEEKGMDTEKIKSAIQFVGRGGRKTQRANSARMLDINTDDPEINGLLLEAASRYTLKKSHQMPIEAYYSTQLVRQAKKDMPADDFKKRFGDLSDEDLDNAGANIHLQNYMVSAIAADILINPHKKTASGESNYDARRLNILARYNPEMAQDLMRMDAAGKFPNKNRRILKSELHQQGLIPDLPTIDSGAINWDEEYMGAMFDAPPRSTELDIQKQMFSRLAEQHPGQYLTAAGRTFPMFKDLASGIHGDDYEEAQGTYAGRLATALLNERKPEDFTRGASEAKTLLTQYLDGGRVRQKAASIALPALTGAVIGSPYVDQGFAVANAPDVSRLLKRMGYDKDVRKDMESAFLDTGLLSNLHMQTSNERTALPMMNLISKQRGDELFPGIKDMVIPKGKMLMGQMDVGAQDKDYDSDLAEMILGGYVDRAVERKDPYIGRGDENLNYHKKIAQAGQGIEKLRGIAEKGYTKGKGVGGLVKSMEQMFKSGFEMSATHPPFVEFLNNFADEVGGQLGIGDDNRKALLNATAMVGNQPYQLAMDNEYSLSGATQYFKRAYREFSIGAPIGESKTRMSVFQNIKKDDPDKQAIPTKGILPGDSPKLALQLLDRAISMERGAKGDYEENHAMYVDNGDRQGYARFLSTALLPVNDAANTDRADHVYKALVKSFEAYGEHTKKSKSEPDLGMNHTGMIDVLQAIAGIEASDEEKDQFRGYLKEDNLVGLQRKDGSGAATKYVRKDNPLMDAALDLMVGSSGAENMNIFGLYAVGVGAANTKQNYHTDPVFTNANAGAPPLDYLGGVTADVRNHIQFRKGNLDSDRMANLAPMRSMPGDTHMLRMQRAAGETEEYARGGYTGDGLKNEESGIVHKGEFVLNQEDVARIQQGRGDEVINHVERELMTDGDLLRTSAGFDGGGYNNGQNTWGGGAQSKAERDAQLRAQYARHGADWTGDEEGGLYNAFRSANVSTPEHLRDFIDSASESMQRSPGSINSRLRQNNLITQELFEQAENVLPFSDPASFPDDRLKVDNSPTPHAKKLAAEAGLMVDQIPLPAGADRLRKEHVQAYIDRRSERTHKRFADLRAGVNRKTGTPNYPSNNDINPGGRPRFGSDGFAGDSVLQGKPDTEAFITYEAGAGRVSEVTLRTRSTAAELDALIKRHTGAITQGMAMSADDYIKAVDPDMLRMAAGEVDRFINMTPEQRGSMPEEQLLAYQGLVGSLETVQESTKMLGSAAMGGNIPQPVRDTLETVGMGLADAKLYGLTGKSQLEVERGQAKIAREQEESRSKSVSGSNITPFNVAAFEEIGKSLKTFAGTLSELDNVVGHVTKGHEGYIKQAKQLTEIFNQEVSTLAKADAALASGGIGGITREQAQVLDRADRQFTKDKTFREYLDAAAPKMQSMEREIMRQELKESGELPYQQIKGKEREELQWDLLRNQHRKGGRERLEEAASQGFYDDFMGGLPASQGMRGLSTVGNLARGFGNMVDPSFIWGTQAIGRFLMKPAQQAMKAYTDEQMVIGGAMLASPSIDVTGLKDSTMFTVLNRRERQEDAQVAMGRQSMSAFGWMQDLFVGEKGTSSILGMLGGIGAPIAGAAGMLQMAAKGFGMGSIQGVPTGLAFGLPAAAISLGAYSLDNASNYYAQGGQKGVLGLFTNPEGTFGNAGSLLQQAFTPNTDRFYQQQGSEIYRTAVDMGATGQYTMDQLMRVSGDVTPLLGLGQTRRVSASDFGRSAVRAGVVERFVKDFQYQGLEVDEETSGRILSMWTSLNPARQIDYPVPDTQEAQQLGDIFVRGAVDPESFRDLLGQVAATRGVSANDTRGRQNIYNEYLDRMSFNPNVMQEMFDLSSTVPMLNQANTARRSVGLANLDDDYLTRFRSADRQQGEVQYQTWMSGRLSTFSFDQQQGNRVTDAMNNGDYAAANRMMSTDNAQNAQLQYYRDNGGALFGAGVNTSTQNMNRVEDYMKNEPQYARMGDEFRQQTMGLLGFANPDVVDQLFNNFAPSNNRARLASSAAEMYAQGINPLEQVSRQLRQTFQAPTSGNVSRLATELVTNMSTQGGLSQSELDNMVVDTLTDEPVQALLNSSQMSGLSVNVSRGVKNRMAVDPAYTQAYSNSILGRDNMFVQTGSASMMAQYGMNAVLANFSPRAATYRQTGLDAASQMYGEYIARGSSDASFGALAGQVTGMNFSDRTNALGMMQGDAMAWSRNQPGSAWAMYDPTTGMRSMYGSISREQYGRVQAASPGWATMPYEEGFSEFGIQSELMQNNRDSFNIGKKYQRIGMNMSYGMTTGDLGMAGAAFNELGMTLNMGNGMGQWQVEDAQRKLSREQSLFGTQQDTKNLDLAQREFGLQGQQFYEKFGLNQRQFQANTDYGRFQQSMGRTQQLAQREWNWEDFNFQGDQMEMEFSWQMDDYNRNIRYARGREKRDLMRNKSRDVTRFAMQSGQRDKVEDRMEQQNEWEDEVFAKEKEHFEQNVQFQQEEMDLSKRHFEQDRALQWERLNMQQEAHTKNVQWMMQKFALEDQAILLDRQSYQANFASQQQELAQMTALQQRAMELQNTLAAITGYYERIGAALSVVDVNAITAALGGAQNPLPGSYTGYSGTAAIQGVAAAPNVNSLPTGVTDALTALYNSYNAPGNNATRPAQGRYASGGYTGRGAKYDAAGVVHRGEYVVPQEGAMVIRGDDPVRAESDQKMLDLMAENNRLLAMIYASPAQYQTIVNGKVVDTMPLEKATRARL